MKKETILITGGTGKLGKVFAKHFAKNGRQVVITTTSHQRARTFQESFDEGKHIETFVCDLSKPGAVDILLDSFVERGIQISHLVNNARSLKSLEVGPNGISSRENIAAEYLLDVIVPYELATGLYLRQKEALKTITNIGSQYGSVAANPALYDGNLIQSSIQYGIAKAALNHLTKELAVRFSKDNIRVNCVAYGGVEGRVCPEFKERYSSLTPMGRMLKEEEIVGPLEFVLSNSSSSVTGHTIAADGGWTIW
ncbi:SDR family oxidoreductase [Gammaproteobacteria bacterium]|nr:SDR family oxidoreductase [Gammaproteobacteria bacterium]